MNDFAAIIVGVAVVFVWIAIWACALHVLGLQVFKPTPEDHARRRERIRRMGQLRYVLIFGVFGQGLGVGLAFTTADLLGHHSHGWVFAVTKLLLVSVLYGWLLGARTWREAFRDPVPFPPDLTRQ